MARSDKVRRNFTASALKSGSGTMTCVGFVRTVEVACGGC